MLRQQEEQNSNSDRRKNYTLTNLKIKRLWIYL